MGCSCGYNVYIKTLITLYFCFLRFHFLELWSLFVRISQLLYSCLFFSFLTPLSCNLYTCTSQPSSYQNGMSSFTTSVKTPNLSAAPLLDRVTSSSTTILRAPKLFSHIFVTNVTKNKSSATRTQSHHSGFELFQQPPDPNIHLQQILGRIFMYSKICFFLVLKIKTNGASWAKKLTMQWPPSWPTLKYCFYITSQLQAHIHFVQFC